jgi:hypothetical protein
MTYTKFLKFTASFLFILMLTITVALPAKDKKITKKDLPAAVLSAFEKAYPKATIKGVGKENENKTTYFEIESIDGKISRDILYTTEGKAYEIEESMSKSDLPKEIQTTLKSQYAKANFVKAEKVTHDSAIGYEIQIKTGKKVKALSFDAAGKLVKDSGKKSEKEENEKDEEEED